MFHILEEKSIELLQKDLKKYIKGDLKAIPQDESLVTYAPKIQKKEAELSFSHEALNLHNKIRGLFMGPKAFCFLDEKKTLSLKITKSQVDTPSLSSFKQGEIIKVKKDSFTVSCHNNTALKILRVQRASKKEMSTEEFLKGYKLQKGGFLY